MLFRHGVLRQIVEGRVTLAFRRWRRPPPAAGVLLRTPLGVVRVESVAVVTPDDIAPGDMARAGLTADELARSIVGPGTLFRIELRFAGDDPRVALRQRMPEGDDLDMLRARLARIDASAPAPWTSQVLEMIADGPGVSARELAPRIGVDVPLFKRRVRRLKELGLTESLAVGYRLSPRGRALLSRLSGC